LLLAGAAFATLGVLHILDPAFLASDLPYPTRIQILPHALSMLAFGAGLFVAGLRLGLSPLARSVVAAVLVAVPLVQAASSLSDSPALSLLVLVAWGLPAAAGSFILFAERAA
jgi:hypothetical protein